MTSVHDDMNSGECPSRHNDSLSTVTRALRVLELIAVNDGVTPKEIAAELDVKLGTMYRLVNTLLDDGYLVRTTGGSLHLGERLPLLLERLDTRLDPYPELEGVLVQLALDSGTTAVLGQLVGRQVRITATQSFPGAEHQHLLRSGLRGPAHSMALGKVLIASLPRRQVAELVDGWSLVQLTDRTIGRQSVLLEAIEIAARRGFGLDLEEGVPGLTCIAAPIATPDGRPQAAIALGLTPDQFKFEGERLVELIVESANRSSLILRGSPDSAPPSIDEPRQGSRSPDDRRGATLGSGACVARPVTVGTRISDSHGPRRVHDGIVSQPCASKALVTNGKPAAR